MSGTERFLAVVRLRGHKHRLWPIVVVGAAVICGLALFPDWVATQPSDRYLILQLGHAPLWSPPGPPKGFEGMSVTSGDWWIVWSLAVAAFAAVACWAVSGGED
jgi:hypothetical protein